ncbi:hypothetical protein ACSBR2_008174 [Camellia fascicularis]
MGDNLMLLCAYGGNNVVVMLDATFTFSHLGEPSGGASQRSVIENSNDKHIHGEGSGFTNDVDKDKDLLPKFRPQAWKVLLSESWTSCISNVRQCFKGGAGKFRKVLSKYAIECGFQFKFKKNNSVRITAICIFNESRGCLWSVHAKVMNVNGFFCLKKWNSEYTCGVAVRITKNPRMGADVMAECIRDKPLTRPTDVKYHFQKDYGLQELRRLERNYSGDHSALFDQLRWYSNTVMEYNRGSYVNLEFDENNTHRFNRLFVSFKACIDGFNHCRQLLFLDGTFLKGRYKGNLLAATTKDGNKGFVSSPFELYILVFSFCYPMFISGGFCNCGRNKLGMVLTKSTNIVDGGQSITFISDHHASFLESIPSVFPTSHHVFCMQHLQRNLKGRMKCVNHPYRIGLVTKFRECAYAPTIADFNHKLEQFIQSSRHFAVNFLKDLDPRHWANAHFRGKRYGEMSSNAAESFNNWIKEARHLPITRLVDAIRVQILNQKSDRRRASST